MAPDRAAVAPPGLPAAERRSPRGPPRREIVDGIRYLVDSGIKWRSMPIDFAPWRTIYGFARRWAAAGVIGVIRDQFRRRIRIARGKTPRAASAIVYSQSIKASETVGRDTRGWDEAKEINGRKRQLVCGNRGLVLLVMVAAANVTDRDAAKELLFRLVLTHPEIAIVWTDSAYAGKLVTWAKTYLDITIKWAAVTLMTRRLTRRKDRPAERRDIASCYLAQAA